MIHHIVGKKGLPVVNENHPPLKMHPDFVGTSRQLSQTQPTMGVLIVERGGMLSHGAIVARDFGIPEVVCPDATRRIPHGARIRVDGNKGKITILDGGGQKA